ncbi:hypothetical protein AAFN47_26505, partial [Hoeflea sp. CAU 1731]
KTPTRKRETLVGLRPPGVPRLRRKVAWFCAALWPTFIPPLTLSKWNIFRKKTYNKKIFEKN